MKRRSFLFKSFASYSLFPDLSFFFNTLTQSLYQNKIKENNIRYLYIQNFGAPARWAHDLFLSPHTKKEDASSPMVINQFVNDKGRYLRGVYKTVPYKDFHVPPIWLEKLSTIDNSHALHSDILENMITLQGGTSQSLSHEDSAAFQHRHSKDTYSLLGLQATLNKNTVIPAISIDNKFINYNAPDQTPLLNVSSEAHDEIKELINKAVTCDEYTQSLQKAFSGSYRKSKDPAFLGAIETISHCLNDFTTQWVQCFFKYQKIITKALHQPIPGISDQPIGNPKERDQNYNFYGGKLAHNDDLRAMISSSTNLKGVAEQFATAELLLTHDISNCISLSIPHLKSLSVKNKQGHFLKSDFFHDQHPCGSITTLFLNSVFFQVQYSCLHSLITSLKKQKRGESNLFNQTLIHVGSEFNRSARVDGSGSDHGHTALSTSFISGMIKKTAIKGKIGHTPKNFLNYYQGSWGFGYPLKSLGNRQFNHGDVNASVAYLTGVPSNLYNGTPLLKWETKNEIAPAIETLEVQD